MKPFQYYNPTRIVFGEGRILELKNFLPADARILFVFDEDAVMQNGVYQNIKNACANFSVVEFGGVKPNPDYEFLKHALPLIQENQINCIVAAGGGSVIDGSKFIAAAACYAGDPWELTAEPFLAKKALPLFVVQTLPATGSEMNEWGVVSRRELKLKRDFSGEALFPKLTILDPLVTTTLPRAEIVNGIIDSFSHVIEQYVTVDADTPLQDRQAEGLLLSIIESARAILKDPNNMHARAEMMWCATLALNDQLQTGTAVDFAAHRLSHALTALYGLKHGETLALLLVPTLSVLRELKQVKLCRYAKMIWNSKAQDESELMQQAIDYTQNFFIEIGAETNPQAYGLTETIIPEVLSYLQAEKLYPLGECHPVYEEEAVEILRQMLASKALASYNSPKKGN